MTTETGLVEKYRTKYEHEKRKNASLKEQIRSLQKDLKLLRRKEKFDTNTREKFSEIIKELEKEVRELPHILIPVQKILSMLDNNKRDNRIFGVSPSETIENIAHHFSVTTEQARTIWNLVLCYN